MTSDITAPLDDLAGRIRAAHAEAQGAFARALDRAMAAGDLLIEAKARLGHGDWLPWLRDACDIPERTAQAYMRLARNRAQLKSATVADFGVHGALALLAEPRGVKGSADESFTIGLSALPAIPPKTRPDPPPPDAPRYAHAVYKGATLVIQINEDGWRQAQGTHYLIAERGVPVPMWADALGVEERSVYRALAMWAAHGRDVLAGAWEKVPSYHFDFDDG